ncbi:choline-binding transcriptional repressor BetI [Pseudoroseicyclus tamaricis]|uniref:HTH-type transcriptional regulator BetI n=2 Tax=Pseudoroseicyclus tamaricis TaxID=2705421 RepID=A0A6B2JP03_9RHOB|nr:transcriptional regulator BetI [Pseudoroseicyclus tamaricis]NDU99777.1 transcriptional regulator BetI [Pseudoroseicyclus tamaricis]
MGVEMRRREELIRATILVIGEAGSLDITVSRIAKKAGVSPALAFHYFGDKERLFLASMRHVLRSYHNDVVTALSSASTPRERLERIVHASFAPANFHRGVIAAWLNFYVLAQSSEEAHRLLRIYHSRLRSNFVHDLRPLVGDRAETVAGRLGALIDGLYLRLVLTPVESAGETAIETVLATLQNELNAAS